MSLLCSSPIKNEQTPYQRNSVACQTIRFLLRNFGCVQRPVIRRVRACVLLILLLTVGPVKSRLEHCSLSRLIVLTPILVPPFISRGAPRQTA
jgi:hypothetical protein